MSLTQVHAIHQLTADAATRIHALHTAGHPPAVAAAREAAAAALVAAVALLARLEERWAKAEADADGAPEP